MVVIFSGSALSWNPWSPTQLPIEEDAGHSENHKDHLSEAQVARPTQQPLHGHSLAKGQVAVTIGL